MIIQSARLRTDLDLSAVIRHVFDGPANEAIEPLYGAGDDLAAMVDDARSARKIYAIRHVKISPGEPMSRTDLGRLLYDLGAEFRFFPDRCVVVEHRKLRFGSSGYDRHWHVLVPEYDPVHRRVLSSHWMRPRQEKLARLAELRLGHRPVVGRWNAAVVRVLMNAGDSFAAEAVTTLAQKPRPESSYAARRHQAAARMGVALPEARAAVLKAWQSSESVAAFTQALAASGMATRIGDKEGVWIIEAKALDGATPVLIGALHRLIREPKRTVDACMRASTPKFVKPPLGILHQQITAAEQRGGSVHADKENHGVPVDSDAYAVRSGGPGDPARATGLQIRLHHMDRLTRATGDPGWVHPQSAFSMGTLSTRLQPEPAHVDQAAVHCIDRAPDARVKRQRWIAMCLRKRYDLAWVPESAVARIATIQWWPEDEALVLTLVTGTRLIDRFDRIEIVGPADEVAIAELVTCVRRRGWTRVQVHGSDRFRAAAAWALLAAGIEVDDPPIAVEEVATLLALARGASPSIPASPFPLQ